MSGEVEKLEKELKALKQSKNSLAAVMKDTMVLGMSELSNAVSKVFMAPKTGKNQINKNMDDWENQIIEQRSVK